MNDAGGDDANDLCVKRKVTDALAAVQVAWKAYWKVIEGTYRLKLVAYNTKIDTDWAAYEVKAKVERKRLFLVK